MGFGKRGGWAVNSRSRRRQLLASTRQLGPGFARPLSQLLGCKQKNPNHEQQNITRRRNVQAPTQGTDFSPDPPPAQVCFLHFGGWEESRGTKPAGAQDGVGFPTCRHTPALPLLAATQGSTGNLIGQNPSSMNMLHLIMNQNSTQWGAGELRVRYYSRFSASGTVHVQLTGSRCEAKQELLIGSGVTHCFTMKKHRSLWSTWCQSPRKSEVSASYCFFRPLRKTGWSHLGAPGATNTSTSTSLTSLFSRAVPARMRMRQAGQEESNSAEILKGSGTDFPPISVLSQKLSKLQHVGLICIAEQGC